MWEVLKEDLHLVHFIEAFSFSQKLFNISRHQKIFMIIGTWTLSYIQKILGGLCNYSFTFINLPSIHGVSEVEFPVQELLASLREVLDQYETLAFPGIPTINIVSGDQVR